MNLGPDNKYIWNALAEWRPAEIEMGESSFSGCLGKPMLFSCLYDCGAHRQLMRICCVPYRIMNDCATRQNIKRTDYITSHFDAYQQHTTSLFLRVIGVCRSRLSWLGCARSSWRLFLRQDDGCLCVCMWMPEWLLESGARGCGRSGHLNCNRQCKCNSSVYQLCATGKPTTAAHLRLPVVVAVICACLRTCPDGRI